MKQKVTILLLCLRLAVVANAQTLYGPPIDYSRYDLMYFDDFNYDPATFKTDAVFTSGGTIGGIATGDWYVGRCEEGAEGYHSIYSEDQVQMDISRPGEIRLNVTKIPCAPVDLRYGCPTGYGPLHRSGVLDDDNETSFKTGLIKPNKQWPAFGIFEARLKFSYSPDATSAKWTWGGFYFDYDYASFLVCEGGDPGGWWSRLQCYKEHYISSATVHGQSGIHTGTVVCDGSGTSDMQGMLLGMWHTFSVEWNPDQCKFYFDGMQITPSEHYDTDIRTKAEKTNPKLAMNVNYWGTNCNNTREGAYMDIDYVKVWSRHCDKESFDINAVSVSSKGGREIIPGLYTNEHIQAGYSPVLIRTTNNNATVFEGESVTLLPNFVADESSYLLAPRTLMIEKWTEIIGPGDTIRHPTEDEVGIITRNTPTNGYFLAQPKQCKECDLGEITTIYDESGNLVFLNSTPGGSWTSSNKFVYVIDSRTGVSTRWGEGTTEITYTVGACTKTVTASIDMGYGKIFHRNDTSNVSTEINGIKSIDIFPNPARNSITISYPCASCGNLAISIKDVAGREMHSESVNCNEGNSVRHDVDISTFSPGVYFVDLTLNEQHVVKKIVKL